MKFFIPVVFLLIALNENIEAFAPSQNQSDFDPSILKIEENNYLGETAPDIVMTDSKGKALKLSDFSGKPVILSIIYYTCLHSCPTLNEGLAEAFNGIDYQIGDEFNVISLSFDSNDNSTSARKFHERIEKNLGSSLPYNFDKWVFATADSDEIEKITKSVGYRYFYSKEDGIFVHPNVYVFLSPGRKITRYIFGLYPPPFDIKLALTESGRGKTGKASLINTAVLACYSYDPSMGGYRINLSFILGLSGFFLAFITGIIVFLYSRKLKRSKYPH